MEILEIVLRYVFHMYILLLTSSALCSTVGISGGQDVDVIGHALLYTSMY